MSTVWMTLNIAIFAPTPSAMVRIAARPNTGRRQRARTANRILTVYAIRVDQPILAAQPRRKDLSCDQRRRQQDDSRLLQPKSRLHRICPHAGTDPSFRLSAHVA